MFRYDLVLRRPRRNEIESLKFSLYPNVHAEAIDGKIPRRQPRVRQMLIDRADAHTQRGTDIVAESCSPKISELQVVLLAIMFYSCIDRPRSYAEVHVGHDWPARLNKIVMYPRRPSNEVAFRAHYDLGCYEISAQLRAAA